MATSLRQRKRPSPLTPHQRLPRKNLGQESPKTPVYKAQNKTRGQQEGRNIGAEKPYEVRARFKVLAGILNFHGELIFHA